MLGAKEPAPAGRRRAPGPAAEAPAPSSPGAGEPVTLTGGEAVLETARRICGAAVVQSVAAAETLGALGLRAAVLAAADPAGTVGAGFGGTWVLHGELPGSAAPSDTLAFELIATDAQQAVDHALVAHRLAMRLARPGACTVEREILDAPAVVRLPEPSSVEAVVAGGGPGAAEPDVLEAAREAFQAVARATGRPLEPVATDGMEGARFALVASGAASARARAIAGRLRSAGVPCGAISLAIVRPSPAGLLAGSLRGLEAVAVIGSGPTADRLCDELRDLARGPGGFDVSKIATGSAPQDLAGPFGLSAEQREVLSRPAAPPAGTITVGVRSTGPAGRRMLLALAGHLGRRATLSLAWAGPEAEAPGTRCLALGPEPADAAPGARVDVMVAPVDRQTAAATAADLRLPDEGGALVLYADASSARAALASLPPERRASLEQGRVRAFRVDPRELAERAAGSAEAAATLMLGALLASHDGLAALAGEDDGDPAEASARLEEGAALLRECDGLPDATPGPAPSQAGLPGMPAEEEPSGEATADRLRRFHVTGRGAHSAADPLELLPLRPAIADALLSSTETPPADAPVFTDDAEAPFTTLDRLLREAVDGLGAAASIVPRHAERLVRLAVGIAAARSGPVPLDELADAAFEAFGGTLDLSEAARGALEQELRALRAGLPRSGRVVGPGPDALAMVYLEAVRVERRPRLEALAEEARRLVGRMDDMLGLDAAHSETGRSADALSSTLGSAGRDLVDLSVLSGTLPPHRGSVRLEPARRRRLERVRAGLAEWLAGAAAAPEAFLVAPGPVSGASTSARFRLVVHREPLECATALFDALAGRTIHVLRALRVARLEVRGEYDEAVHGSRLEALDWQALTADELLLVPPIAVLEDGRRLTGRRLAALSEVLRSGRPVHVLATEPVLAPRSGATGPSSGSHPGLGYLAVAHREPFVLQSSLGRPEHLAAGLLRMLGALGPALTLVAVPERGSAVPSRLALAAAEQGRATPCFTYDPAAGETWAERFDLTANVRPELAFPTYTLRYAGDEGAERTLEEAFTFAHAAALDPEWRDHFRVVRSADWTDEQRPLADWLAAGGDERRKLVPFLWALDRERRLARAVITRELAFAARDRQRAWRILQELAGTDNEYAHRAAEQARRQAAEQAEARLRELEAAHARELEEVREHAAGEALERLAAALLDLDLGAPAPAPPAATPLAAPAVAGPPAPAPAAEPEPEPAPAPEPEEDLGLDEPYIDSMLCTTCNECTDLNGRMFRYNENRQAYIADAAAGTFEDLVRAAEKCPARCIHPGAPRAGDASATDDLIRRAKAFG